LKIKLEDRKNESKASRPKAKSCELEMFFENYTMKKNLGKAKKQQTLREDD
jgi:hypothetical protein